MAYEVDSEGTRWETRPACLVPAGLLQDAAPARELEQVRPTIAAWGSAFQVQMQHEAELASIYGVPAARVRS
jgi:hypothetical protein